MILIDAIYIHSHGGKTILDSFISAVEKNPNSEINNFHFLIDDRLDLSLIQGKKNYSYERVNASHFNRQSAYQRNINIIDKIVCLANIPPPINSTKKVYIYFHNLLLLDNKMRFVSFFHFILNKIKLSYIKFYNKSSYNWIVQTGFMKDKLSKKLNINKESIDVIPFYNDDDIIFTKKDFSSKSINFLCVTSNARHKNLKNLVTSFINAKLDSKKKFSLFITTSGNNFIKENKKIIYLNYINREEMLRYYSKSHFIVLPSLIESFGLPIVEGIKSGSNVLISNIDSLKEICTPSISFNPLNIKDLISALEKAASLSYEKNSLLTIKNEINNFIDIINRDV